ncbi:hypothetical protein ACJX0J_006268, partial [Zea mays]
HNLGNNLDAAVLEQIHNFLFIDRIACSASLSRPVLFQEVQHHNNEFAVVDFGIVVAIFAIIGLWSDAVVIVFLFNPMPIYDLKIEFWSPLYFSTPKKDGAMHLGQICAVLALLLGRIYETNHDILLT